MSKKAVVPELPIRILKIGTCSTLSGRSELTYHLGGNAVADLQFRVATKSGGGFFNADWIPLESIRNRLDQHLAEKPMTSHVLQPLYRGKSANSPAFLFAVLKAEGLIKAAGDKQHECGDPGAFLAEMEKLVSSSIDLAEGEKPQTSAALTVTKLGATKSKRQRAIATPISNSPENLKEPNHV